MIRAHSSIDMLKLNHVVSHARRGVMHASMQRSCAVRQGQRQQARVRGPSSAHRRLHIVQAAAVDVDKPADADSIVASKRKYVMVSGKGGVGKTSLSASLAVKYASEGHDTLIVSTDPAHSLGDSLGQRLPGGVPVPIEGTDLPVWGMEIDPDKVTDEFKAFASTGGKEKVQSVLDRFGMGKMMDALSDLGLDELLSTPPPGLDEAIAISKVVEFVESADYARFTRIVFDTAPTGHTLRMLTLPDFVSATLTKVSTLQKKLGAAGEGVLSVLFGSGGGDAAVKSLHKLQARVDMVARLFRDQENMEFVIATIPTVLAIEESTRLLKALRKEGVPTHSMVVNQVIGESMGAKFLEMKLKEQTAAMKLLSDSAALRNLQVIKGKLLDLEVRGVPALQYFATTLWQELPLPMGGTGEGLVATGDRRFYMLGGKGGVGKTTSSAALAVHLATQNLPTLVVSTDPAHSLSDALMQDISGGEPVRLSGTDLELWGMEMDPVQAREELRSLAREDGGSEVYDMMRSVGLGAFADQLQDLKLGELLDNSPPGIDEAVAISRVVRFLRNPAYQQFRCVVFDTAPTGHTLRLLTLPDFLNTSVGKLVRLRFTIASSIGKVTDFFSRKKATGRAVDKAMDKLNELQGAMEEAKQLFRDKERTEFIIVTIPTVMAMSESERLATSLLAEEVPCKRIVVNQVVDETATDKFLASRRADQQRALKLVDNNADLQSLDVIQAPLLDLEVRGVPALQYFGSQVWREGVTAPHERPRQPDNVDGEAGS